MPQLLANMQGYPELGINASRAGACAATAAEQAEQAALQEHSRQVHAAEDAAAGGSLVTAFPL